MGISPIIQYRHPIELSESYLENFYTQMFNLENFHIKWIYENCIKEKVLKRRLLSVSGIHLNSLVKQQEW